MSLAGSSPISTTASAGCRPWRARSSHTLFATLSSRRPAMARPSMIFAMPSRDPQEPHIVSITYNIPADLASPYLQYLTQGRATVGVTACTIMVRTRSPALLSDRQADIVLSYHHLRRA